MSRKLTKSEIEAAVSDVYADCIEAQFGLWITGLFYWWPDLTLEDQKRAFFLLLRKLLEEGRIKFIKPDADIYFNAEHNPNPKLTINEVESHWEADTDEILSYLNEKWPHTAKDEHDVELNAYFYEIPAIIWRGDDGKWIGS